MTREKRGGRESAPTIRFLDHQGVFELSVRSEKTRARVASYFSALSIYFGPSVDATRIRAFEGQSFVANGIRYRFLTDLDALERLGYAGELEFEDLYADTV